MSNPYILESHTIIAASGHEVATVRTGEVPETVELGEGLADSGSLIVELAAPVGLPPEVLCGLPPEVR